MAQPIRPIRPVQPVQPGDEEEASGIPNAYRPVDIQVANTEGLGNILCIPRVFCLPPFFGPLLFPNTNSDARDHCANERTFLSYLRLSIYMSIVAIAIIMSFHLKSQPTQIELRMAQPLGIIFWCLSVSCLALGVGNYMKTVKKYSRRSAIVQTGWKTQAVLTVIAFCIVGVCILFLATNAQKH